MFVKCGSDSVTVRDSSFLMPACVFIHCCPVLGMLLLLSHTCARMSLPRKWCLYLVLRFAKHFPSKDIPDFWEERLGFPSLYPFLVPNTFLSWPSSKFAMAYLYKYLGSVVPHEGWIHQWVHCFSDSPLTLLNRKKGNREEGRQWVG